ncbi:RNA-guided endonuclease TnpB family protein [Arthrobacter sp. I2-34]|uniref:RNA-guided endonuclease TnpB family protein n=1 Tax=Arthrobacter hankyongi TaxID=2904801 RepID=A0ABS9LD64_9MICC|nr:RNA-guided endonuclease TnpB family protein [Arthrobacter hankyongi]
MSPSARRICPCWGGTATVPTRARGRWSLWPVPSAAPGGSTTWDRFQGKTLPGDLAELPGQRAVQTSPQAQEATGNGLALRSLLDHPPAVTDRSRKGIPELLRRDHGPETGRLTQVHKEGRTPVLPDRGRGLVQSTKDQQTVGRGETTQDRRIEIPPLACACGQSHIGHRDPRIGQCVPRFLCRECSGASRAPSEREAGVDLGLHDFAAVVYSDGTREKIQKPRHMGRVQARLRQAQKDLSRKMKGSNNRKKAKQCVARPHAKVKRQRMDFLHKQSTQLVNENQVTVTEGFTVRGLARSGARGRRGRGMRRSIHDAGGGIFLSLLFRRATERGREHITTDKFCPSTRRCCLCGTVGTKKELSVRTWTCACSPEVVLDRDYNAAVNELVAGGHAAYGKELRRVLATATDVRSLEK